MLYGQRGQEQARVEVVVDDTLYGDGLIAELHWSGGQLYWLVGGVVI